MKISTTHAAGIRTSKTEDLNHNNTLDVGEDIGIPFENPDATITTLGAGNLRIDSNDLDRNGALNNEDPASAGTSGMTPAAAPL